MDTLEDAEVSEYFTSYNKSLGRVTGYVLMSNNLFFHVKDAHIVNGHLFVDNIYKTELVQSN